MSRHEVLHVLSDDRKKESLTMATNSIQIISLLQNRTVLFDDVSNIWENTDVCDEQYLFATEIYLL